MLCLKKEIWVKELQLLPPPAVQKTGADNRGKESEASTRASRKSGVKKHDEDRYVAPHGDDWGVKKEKEKKRNIQHEKEAAKKQSRERKNLMLQ
jgi:hypothetical protein